MRLFKAGLVVSLFTLLSRIFGLLRELAIAYIFGTGSSADSILVAFRLPNLFRRILGEGALSSVFIPMYTNKKNTDPSNAVEFTHNIISTLVILLIILTLIFIIFMDDLMYVIAPGFFNDPEKLHNTVLLCQITIPYLIFICCSALLGGILNANKKFAAFAFMPVIGNIVIIIFITITTKIGVDNKIFISIGILVSGMVQLLFMLYAVKSKITLKLHIPKLNDDLKIFIKRMLPAIMGNGITQINLFLSQSISSFIPSVISIISYADRIYQLPLSIIGTSISTILLPEISTLNKDKDINKIINKALKLANLLCIPAAFGIFILSHDIISIIYERGEFTAQDTINTSQAMALFAFGIPSFVLNKIYTSVFYAHMNTKIIMRVTFYSLILNTVLNVLLLFKYEHLGIAAATVISSWFNIYLLRKHAITNHYILNNQTFIFTFKVLFSAILMAFIVYTLKPYIISDHTNIIFRSLTLSSLILLGIITYSLCLLILGIKRDFNTY